MPAEPFEIELETIFQGCRNDVGAALQRARLRAETLQAEDTRRLAFTLTETIDHAVAPSIDKAVAAYDEALHRPMGSNPQWEAAIQAHVAEAVAAGVAQALTLDNVDHPWKPLLKAEGPNLRQRLATRADEGLAHVRLDRAPRRRRRAIQQEWMLRLSLLAVGLLAGAILRGLIGP
jgi:hypothetical protein